MSELAYDLRARRQLGLELEQMRCAAQMSQSEAAEAANLTQTVLERLERGDFAATPPLARSLMRLYGRNDLTMVDGMLSLVAEAWQPGWWSDARHQGEAHLAWEASAATSYEVAPVRIPDLLQTKAYAGTVWSGLTAHYHSSHEAEQTIEATLDVLAMRQYRLVGRPVLQVHAVVTEAALRALVGNELIMLAQWMYLARVASWLAVSLRVLPSDAEVRAPSGRGWQLLEFAEPHEPARLFRKTGTLQPYQPMSSHAAVQRARQQFDRLCTASLPPSESVEFLNSLIDQTMAAHPIAARS